MLVHCRAGPGQAVFAQRGEIDAGFPVDLSWAELYRFGAGGSNPGVAGVEDSHDLAPCLDVFLVFSPQ